MIGNGNSCTFLRVFAGVSVTPYHASLTPVLPVTLVFNQSLWRRDQYHAQMLQKTQVLRLKKCPEQRQEDRSENEVFCILEITLSKIRLDANLLVLVKPNTDFKANDRTKSSTFSGLQNSSGCLPEYSDKWMLFCSLSSCTACLQLGRGDSVFVLYQE